MDVNNSQKAIKVEVKTFSTIGAYLLMVHTVVVMISGENTVSLDSKNGHVVKGGNLTLTCSASGGQWFNLSLWVSNYQSEVVPISYNHTSNECTAGGVFKNESQYDCSCVGHNKYRTVIMNVGLDRHGETWQCYMLHLNGTESRSSEVTINVDVPVTNVSINNSALSTIEVHENTNLTFQCMTSPCRPAANITWYFVDKQDINRNVDFAENTVVVTDNNLTSTRSSIWSNTSRDMDGWSVRCNASNIPNYPEPTDSVKLNVTFPTNVPTIQCSDAGTYRVIRNRFSNVTCTVDGGNPAGRLEWSCDRNSIHSQVPQSNIYRTMVLNATQNTTCTCSSSNVAGNRTTSVTLDVMYPPVLKTNNYTSIIDGETLFLKCDVVSSHPSVSKIGWTYNTHNVSDATLIIPNVSRTDDMVYTCTAKNTMNQSCGDVVIGSTSKSIHVDVLYPPLVTIQPPRHFTRNESDLFNYTCPITKGNPSSTTVVWRRSRDNTIWNSRELFLSNVSRHDDSVYTCYASNVMTDSNGTTRYGNSSGYITLHVQFPTNVTNFFIHNYEQTTSVVVMEHTNLTFECRVQSKPTADVRILKRNTTVIESSNTNVLVYNMTASCSGKSVSYSCKGINLLSTNSSTRDVQLTVKCKPRADTNAAVQFIVASAINQTVKMSYTAVAYPPPSFLWYRNGSSIGDPRTSVSSSTLQTTLTIQHVDETDFGEYYLNITNDVGSINKLFHLKPEGVPEVPTTLTQDNTSTTHSTISLLWMSGFNNGQEQTFTILYRKQSGGDWRSANIPDRGQTTINYTIRGLSQDTTYSIVLFAVNEIGSSKSNATLTCTTKPAHLTQSQGPSSAIIGGIVGSVAGILIIAGAIVGLIIFRRRVQKKPYGNHLSTETEETTASMYENVKNGKGPLVKQGLNPPDRGVYENAELGKSTKQMSHGETSIQAGVYVNTSKTNRTKDQRKQHEDVPMRMQSSLPDRKVTTHTPQHQDVPPPISAKTDLAAILISVDDDDAHVSINTSDENVYNNSTFKIERIENVFVHELFDFVGSKPLESFGAEFNVLPKGLTMPYTVAVKPDNIKLNRYNGIFPYDHSRVTIPEDPDFFTNACYMDGYKREKCYIASLGPTSDSSKGYKTFWRMVWHEQSDVIVMVTNLREITGMKCEQYWPKYGCTLVYGAVTVTWKHVEEYAEYTVRTFNVSHGDDNRTVTQLHFTAWPDKGVPDDLTSVLEFRQRINMTHSNKLGPVIVHCSAGIGRTGTYIALDRLIAEGKATNSINVSTCVRSMRQQRVSMVQTLEQYMYIYKACVYALASECDSFSAGKFHDTFKKITDAQFTEMFKKLRTMVDNEKENEKKAILSNKLETSNRQNADIAGDIHRVRLYVDKESDEADYTNAVYINSFKTKNKFITAQTPLRDFVQDFVCAIFQEQCICVVDLDGATPSKMDIGIYLPPGQQSVTFGNFTISCDKLESTPKYTVNKMKIVNTGKIYAGEWSCYHFKYHEWKHGKETPGNANDFLDLWKEVNEYADQFGEKESHILIHCLDGSNRSGLFCFVACLLEKVKCERQVNIGNTLRQVRTRRKTTVRNVNQLKFCFKVVDAFTETSKAK